MFKFLFVLFFFFLLLLFLMGFSILRTFKTIFFGSGSSQKTPRGNTRPSSNRASGSHPHSTNTNSAEPTVETEDYQSPPRPRQKIFSKDEGEYVDYEEVK